ncbi:TPA: hypothetical protein DCX15_06460 [bacterium]|nr:hypothetical protein [bacterium]
MKVALFQVKSYEGVEEKIREGIEAMGGISQFAKKGDKVLLKPNLLGFYRPERGITTHPSIVKAVARIVRECGATPIIADSPGMGISYTQCSLKKLYEVCGITMIEEAVLNYDTRTSKLGHFEIIRPVIDCNLIINIPKLKTHALTVLTGAVKNLYGLIPGLSKLSYHLTHRDTESFSRLLFELLEVIEKPQLAIVDGIIGMDGDGPMDGNLRNVGVIIISDTPILADLIALKIVGIPCSLLPGHKKRQDLLKSAELFGDPLSRLILKEPFILPKSIPSCEWLSFLKPLLTATPVIRKDCNGCGTCVNVCLQGAIRLEQGRASIEDRLCIRCYCCQESCPNQAIALKRSILYRFILRITKTRYYRIFEKIYHLTRFPINPFWGKVEDFKGRLWERLRCLRR